MKRFVRGVVVLGLLVAAGLGAGRGFGGAWPVDWLPALSSGSDSTATAADRDTPTPSATGHVLDAADQDVSAAIQQVIQHSNDEQAQAIAARDPSAMADTVTAQHLAQLVQVNQKLLGDGVTAISLVKIEWGAIAIDASGTSASATTYETWTTTLFDGSEVKRRDRNDYALVLDNAVWKIDADTQPQQDSPADEPAPGIVVSPPGPSVITPPPLVPFPGVPDSQNTSHNWSGYAATGGTFTGVSGTWSVPEFNPDGSPGIDAAWVGIGGVRGRDLIQAGTQQSVSGSGTTRYEAWVEALPAPSRAVPLQVRAGDSVNVSISEQSPDEWSIAFTNFTTGQTYQTTEQYRSSHSSAEWVEEAPSAGGRGGVLPLDNFGTIQFSSGSAIENGQSVSIAAAKARAITMVGGAEQALAIPSALGDDGASFSVARTDASSSSPGSTSRRGSRGRRSGN